MAARAFRSFPRAEPSEIQRSLVALAEAARDIDTRTFEVAPRTRVEAEMLPALERVLDAAVVLLGEVLERYDALAPESLADASDSGVFGLYLDDIVAEANPTSPDQRIADISFMARWELIRKRAAIGEALEGDDDWRLIAQCCSARRRVVKAASAVERVVAEIEGLPSLFTNLYVTERQRAIQTRAAYYVFGVGVRAASTLWLERDPQRCLRLIGAGIAQLVGRPIYEELRIEDRRLLRSLQARLVEWLRGDHDHVAGRRLVSEIVAASSLLMAVNQRPVLIEHDCEVLDKLIALLGRPAINEAHVHLLLTTLRGRDPELDQRIDRRCDLVPANWLDVAQRTLGSLREPVVRAAVNSGAHG